MMRPSSYAIRGVGIVSLVCHDRLGNYPGRTRAASTRLSQSSVLHVLCRSQYTSSTLALGGVSLVRICVSACVLRILVQSGNFVAWQRRRLRRTVLESTAQTLQAFLGHGSRFACRGWRL